MVEHSRSCMCHLCMPGQPKPLVKSRDHMTLGQLGQHAYEAYANTTNWKSLVSGDQLPTWDALPFDIQRAWTAAAAAVRTEVVGV